MLGGTAKSIFLSRLCGGSDGYESKARAPLGCAIVCVYRNDDYELIHIRASKVGENGIKPDVWYTLNSDAEFIEVE